MYPNTNILHRIFNVRVANHTTVLSVGTAFVVDEDNREYLVTARHMAEPLGSGVLQVLGVDGWVTHSEEAVGHGSQSVDVSVIALARTIVPENGRFPVAFGMGGMIYGHEVLFLGFPTGYDPNSVPRLASGSPLPLVKYARMSSLPLKGFPMWLDGHNNPGFSGSPLCFVPSKSGELSVAGVVTAYQYLREPVYAKGDSETDLYVHANMGLIQAWDIQHALDLIHKNPVGAVIS